MNKLTTLEMEIAIADGMCTRQNLIVPNISWGMFGHECDLIVLTRAGLLWEIEIKVTRADLIKDKKKEHGHFDEKISRLYFAIPDYLIKSVEHIPERAGIMVVESETNSEAGTHRGHNTLIREPQVTGKYKLTDKERYQVARLGALRIFGLKKKIRKLKNG